MLRCSWARWSVGFGVARDAAQCWEMLLSFKMLLLLRLRWSVIKPRPPAPPSPPTPSVENTPTASYWIKVYLWFHWTWCGTNTYNRFLFSYSGVRTPTYCDESAMVMRRREPFLDVPCIILPHSLLGKKVSWMLCFSLTQLPTAKTHQTHSELVRLINNLCQ